MMAGHIIEGEFDVAADVLIRTTETMRLEIDGNLDRFLRVTKVP